MTHDAIIEIIQAHKEGKTIVEYDELDKERIIPTDFISWDFGRFCYEIVEPLPQPLTREEITAQWVRDNGVNRGDVVMVLADASFSYSGDVGTIEEIGLERVKVRYTDGNFGTWPIESIKKVTFKIFPFSFEDRELFRDKWIRTKGYEAKEFLITFISEEKIKVGSDFYTYEEALEMLEFIDGKPFGKEVWE